MRKSTFEATLAVYSQEFFFFHFFFFGKLLNICINVLPKRPKTYTYLNSFHLPTGYRADLRTGTQYTRQI